MNRVNTSRRGFFARAMIRVSVLGVGLWIHGADARAEDSLSLTDGEGFPGDRGLAMMVLARHDDLPIHGLSVALACPPDVLRIVDISRRGTAIEQADADFVQSRIDSGAGHVALGVIFDYYEPIVGDALPPTGSSALPQVIARLFVDVLEEATPGEHEVIFLDGLFEPPIVNMFTHRGQTIRPRLASGSFLVRDENAITVDSRFGFAGSRSTHRAYAHHPDALVGYQVALNFDRRALTLESAAVAGTDAAALVGGLSRVEFLEIELDESFSETQARSKVGVIFDFLQPFDDTQVLRPEMGSLTAQSIVEYSFLVEDDSDALGESVELALVDLGEEGAFNNAFLVEGGSIEPELNHGRIYFSTGQLEGRVIDLSTGEPVPGATVEASPGLATARTDALGDYVLRDMPAGAYTLRGTRTGFFPGRLVGVTVEGRDTVSGAVDLYLSARPEGQGGFRRGFINGDAVLDLSDAIGIFEYLFLGVSPPACLKAVDVNDDSLADLTDGVFLLEYQFLGRSAPPPPFAECGTDPTAGDDLTCIQSPVCP